MQAERLLSIQDPCYSCRDAHHQKHQRGLSYCPAAHRENHLMGPVVLQDDDDDSDDDDDDSDDDDDD